ncbi:hypothetical protein ACFVZ3_08625 [Kitasatospora purpeofusca]|uniref:hypothetical protein n=1 Tax=Kitasatospora purpeofusca TaxID=67352 RepID=UPI0036B0D049
MNSEVYTDRLLHWMLQQTGGNESRFMESSSWIAREQIPADRLDSILGALQGRGLVEVLRDFDDGPPTVRATQAGLLEAQRQDHARHDDVQRIDHAENAIIRWAFNQRSTSQHADLSHFSQSPQSYFYGDALTIGEITEAARYLIDRQLLGGAGADLTGRPFTTVWLTADGRDCALSGKPVRSYVEGRTNGGTIWNINGSQNFIAGSQENVTQTNTASVGFNVGEIRNLVELIRRNADLLGLSETQHEDLIVDAETLEEAVAEEIPNTSRIRSSGRRIRDTLSAASSNPIIQQALLSAFNQGLGTVLAG